LLTGLSSTQNWLARFCAGGDFCVRAEAGFEESRKRGFLPVFPFIAKLLIRGEIEEIEFLEKGAFFPLLDTIEGCSAFGKFRFR
jgi:hypothetical protein